jgi:hypothetical protein
MWNLLSGRYHPSVGSCDRNLVLLRFHTDSHLRPVYGIRNEASHLSAISVVHSTGNPLGHLTRNFDCIMQVFVARTRYLYGFCSAYNQYTVIERGVSGEILWIDISWETASCHLVKSNKREYNS